MSKNLLPLISPSHPKNYHSEFFLIESRFKKYQKNFLDKNTCNVFSTYIRLALSSLRKHSYKYSVHRNNIFFPQTTLGLIRQILIFFFISLPVRFFSKKKLNIIDLPSMHHEVIFKSYLKKKYLNFIVEKNTGFILSFFLLYFVKRSKIFNKIKLSFYNSKKNGLKSILKNQDQLKIEIKKLINFVIIFLKVTKTKNIINSDSQSIKGTIIAIAGKKTDKKVHEYYHGFYNKNSLIGVYPSNADFQFHWTKNVIKSFSSCIPKKFKNKYKCFGYPVSFNSKIRKLNSVLILFPPIWDFSRKESINIIKNLQKVINHFSKFVDVRVRFHPSITDSARQKYNQLIVKNGGSISTYKDPITDLNSSIILFGFTSTLLVSAIYNNIPALKFKSYNFSYCDKVKEISFRRIYKLFQSKDDLYKFCKFFKYIKEKKFRHLSFIKFINRK